MSPTTYVAEPKLMRLAIEPVAETIANSEKIVARYEKLERVLPVL